MSAPKPISIPLAVHKPFLAAPATTFKDRLLAARQKPKDDVDHDLFYPDYSKKGALATAQSGQYAEEGETLSARFAMQRQQAKVDEAKAKWLQSNAKVEQIKDYTAYRLLCCAV